MEREVRFRRDREGIQNTTQATTRTQFAERAVEPVDQSGLITGSATAKAFSDFFGMGAKGLALMSDLDSKREIAEIKFRNQEQQYQAVADANAGRGPDEALVDDRDYMSAYKITKGQAASVRLVQDWSKIVDKLPWDANFDEERDKFLKAEVGQGVGDPLYDATLLAGFKKHTDAQRATWVQNQTKQVDIQGQQELETVIGNRVQTADLSPETFDQDVKKAQTTFFRHNPAGAAPWVLTKIMGAVTSNTSQITDKFLRDGGYDKQFPQAYAEMSEKLAGKFNQGITLESAEHWNQLDRDIADESKLLKDPGLMRDLRSRALYGKSYFTNDARFTATWAKLDAVDAQIVKNTAGFNQYVAQMANPGSSYFFEPSAVNKFQFQYLQSRGIDPIAQPDAAAAVVAMNRGIASDLKANMVQALTDSTNQSAQVGSYLFFKALESTGKVNIKQEMGQVAYDHYSAIRGLSGNDNSKVAAAITRIIADPSLKEFPSNPAEFRWNEAYGQPSKKNHEIYTQARTDLHDGFAKSLELTNWFGSGKGGKVVMSGSVEEDLMSTFGRHLMLNTRVGMGDAKERALKDTLSDIGGQYMLVPKGDGKFSVERNVLPKGSVVPTPERMSGFMDDAKALRGALPGLFDDVHSVSLEADRTNHGLPWRTELDGSFNIKQGSDLVMLEPGQKIALNIKPTIDVTQALEGSFPATPTAPITESVKTLSKDPQEALKELNAILPKGVTAVPWVVSGKTAFKLSYKFSDGLKTPQELAEGYAGKAGERAAQKALREQQTKNPIPDTLSEHGAIF